jgi:hypothetical protein
VWRPAGNRVPCAARGKPGAPQGGGSKISAPRGRIVKYRGEAGYPPHAAVLPRLQAPQPLVGRRDAALGPKPRSHPGSAVSGPVSFKGQSFVGLSLTSSFGLAKKPSCAPSLARKRRRCPFGTDGLKSFASANSPRRGVGAACRLSLGTRISKGGNTCADISLLQWFSWF